MTLVCLELGTLCVNTVAPGLCEYGSTWPPKLPWSTAQSRGQDVRMGT